MTGKNAEHWLTVVRYAISIVAGLTPLPVAKLNRF